MEFDDNRVGIDYVLGDLWMNADKFREDEAWEMLRLLMDEFAICSFIFAVLKADSRKSYIQRSVIYNCLNDFSIELRKLAAEFKKAVRREGWRVKKAKVFSLLAMKFQDCMAHFRPIIGRGVDDIIHLQCRIQWKRFDEWRKLFSPQLIDVSINFLFLKQECFSSNMKSCLEAIPEIFLSLDSFLVEIVPPLTHGNYNCSSLLNLVGGSIAQAVHFLYFLSTVDFSGQNFAEQEKLANNLLKELIPITPATIDIFVNALKASTKFKSWSTRGAASHFVHLLIPSGDEGKGSSLVGIKTFQKALTGLMSFLFHAPEYSSGTGHNMKMLLIRIRHMASQFGSLSHLLYSKKDTVVKETGLKLFKLLDKIEFLNLELLALELENLMVNLQMPPSPPEKMKLFDEESINHERKSRMRARIQDLIDSLHEGLGFLSAFLADLGQVYHVNNVRKMKRFWRHIEDLTRVATFVFSTFDSGSITATSIDEFVELQWKIKLLKIEVNIMDLLEDQSSLYVATS